MCAKYKVWGGFQVVCGGLVCFGVVWGVSTVRSFRYLQSQLLLNFIFPCRTTITAIKSQK